MDYITKAECEKRGFVRGEDGLYRKLSTLEHYAKAGWLNLGDGRYSALDRVSAGSRLGRDFYLGGLEAVRASDIGKIRVDGHTVLPLPVLVIEARGRFNKACRSVPREFWPVIHRVCCEDKEIIARGDSERQRSHNKYIQVTFLCLGLDRLIDHYRRVI